VSFYIKNMVCARCIRKVERLVTEAGLEVKNVHLGEAELTMVEGVTTEKYIIAQKIERVKELLLYNERSLSEIAWQTGYSSTQHLSNQFRQVTGLTPTQFKAEHRQYGRHERKPLDAM